MGVKLRYEDEEMLITKGLGNGITKVETGKYRVDFTPAETKSLEPNFYVYDLRLSIGSTVFTPLYGYLNIMETVFE
jgi:thiosulfate reductase cytochrome b subunit